MSCINESVNFPTKINCYEYSESGPEDKIKFPSLKIFFALRNLSFPKQKHMLNVSIGSGGYPEF